MIVRALAVGLVTLAACRNSGRDQPGTCLPSPGAGRSNLVADPFGGGLYWLEDVRSRDYDGELGHVSRLVRFDLRNHRREVIADGMVAPVVFVGKRLVARRNGGGLVLIARDGSIQELAPGPWSIDDFEVIDDHTLAVQAQNDAHSAVYTLDLDEPRPKYVCDADTLLSVSKHHVYVIAAGQGVSVDLNTGARHSFTPTKHFNPLGAEQLEVEDGELRAHSMVDGTVRTLPVPHGEWRLTYMNGEVLARTTVRHGRSDDFLVTTHGVIALPSVLGGTAIFGVAELDGERWALIGHNTSRYGGDLADVPSEADVCLLPESGALTIPTRDVPLRYAASAPALFAAAARLAPGSELQVFDDEALPTTVSLALGEDAGSDFALMRARARVVQRAVTAILRDPEIRTDVTFHDRRRAVFRWWRSLVAGRTYVGMGDAMLQDAEEVGLELRDGTSTHTEGTLRCAGTLVNTSRTTAESLTIRCSPGDRDHAIPVPALAAGASFHFDRTFATASGDMWAQFELVRGDEQIWYIDANEEALTRKLFDLATRVYASTGLALSEHAISYSGITVTLRCAAEFATAKPELRERLAREAYAAYGALRELYPTDHERTLHLTIQVDEHVVTYDYDGHTLTTNE
jgi:hypothetical protein